MARVATAFMITVLTGCGLLSPQLDVAVENNSNQEVVLEMLDGIVGATPPPATISRAAVPAGQATTVSMPRAGEWTLLVNGEAIYDSLHEPSLDQPVSLAIEIAADGSVNVLAP